MTTSQLFIKALSRLSEAETGWWLGRRASESLKQLEKVEDAINEIRANLEARIGD